MSSDQQLPILLFPTPGRTDREKRPPYFPQIQYPSATRQGQRLGPKFNTLQNAFDSQRLQLQGAIPQDNPELVLVLESVGPISSFVGAVKRIPGLEWLLEADEFIDADDDFYDRTHVEQALSGNLFLLGTNQQALVEIIALWQRYQENPSAKFERGFNAWKSVFEHLKDIRFWSPQDRLSDEVLAYWQDRLAADESLITFEIEAWCFSSSEKNVNATEELTSLIASLSGRILSSALITEIGYHGFLVELPANAVRQIISETPPALVLSERVMFFRPRGQAIVPSFDELACLPAVPTAPSTVSGLPVVALLDGLPMQNHPSLSGRLIVDDPDNWEPGYPAQDRVHGTAMASLIALGELDGPKIPLRRPIYVRPILRPDPAAFRSPRIETTPNDVLLIDLVHRSVRRLFEGDGDLPPAAPSVRVINLSVGDAQQPFNRTLSTWARLLDWLSHRYQVLFVVSAGNAPADLILETPRDTLAAQRPEHRQTLALQAFFGDATSRRLISPAESINAVTVGAAHMDAAPKTSIPGRYDLFPEHCVSPYSRIGHGFRRSIKPEIMMPGGRVLHREKTLGAAGVTEITLVDNVSGPGHKVATPPNAAGDNTRYTRGTSNATALATRGAAQAYDVIDLLRAGDSVRLPEKYDAVLLKALLAHGADWGQIEDSILRARPDLSDRRAQQDFITRFAGYGLADIDRALTCTEQRATLIGVGELKDGEALEFQAPLPPSLIAQTVKRRLTITLAWFSPVNTRNAKYRTARLWIQPPGDALGASRANYEWRHVQRGTLQHEILEGTNALAFVDGERIVFKVNCSEDGGKITTPVSFALCVSLEVAEGVALPIYQEIRQRVAPRVGVGA
jgi:hypothetical protein